jgi:hypothetical protein
MRLVSCLLMAIGLTVLAALALSWLPSADGAEPCCSKQCTFGCDGERPCVKCAGARWERHGEDQYDLVDRAGRQLGAYRPSDDVYRARCGDAWGPPCAPPLPPPEDCRVTDYGARLPRDARAGWSISGQPVAGGEALRALAGGPALPDDAGKGYVLWVGGDATGAKITADAGDRARVQSVPPGHWMTLDRDGRPLYAPGVWYVRPDGTAIGHDAQYAGPDQLAEGLRRMAPDWKPDAVPDLKPPAPAPAPQPAPAVPAVPAIADLSPLPAHAGAMAAGGVVAGVALLGWRLWRRRRRA